MYARRTLAIIWFIWVITVIVFQAWVSDRIVPQWPDNALSWTTLYTGLDYQMGQKYLLEPFMNEQVSWDSEYYLAIAVGGYDDPATDLVGPANNQWTKSYAFFPLYPWLIRLFAGPLSLLGLNPIATATLAGVFVSALGALAGMLALHDLTVEFVGDAGGLRAAFYLIIFPTGFFLVQVYTEGLFVGLAFGCLAMLKRRQWFLAAILASGVVLTRAVGIVIMVPMLMAWIRSGDWIELDQEWMQIFSQGTLRRIVLKVGLIFMPLAVFLLWLFSYLGQAFDFVEVTFFGNRFMDLGRAYRLWVDAFQSLSWQIPQRAANYSIIIFLSGLSVCACLKARKHYPEVAWFSIMLFIITWGSGPASGMHRYILTMPAMFTSLAEWGENPIFDRAWTIISLLWMGILAGIFALDMWVA